MVLITIDTLRADHVGAYGFESAHTPNIDRLAREGVRFDQTATTAPLTLPAHASLLTGQYPFTHGVRDNLNSNLDARAPTLAELLGAAGYSTGGFVGAYVLGAHTGIAQGFDQFTDFGAVAEAPASSRDQIRRRADAVVDEALAWIGARETPFFAWIHLFDPHLPYDAPEPWASRFPTRPYDAEVAYADAAVGRIRAALDASGTGENTVLILTADHGEGLGEHSERRHGTQVYDTTIRVPLVIWGPSSLPAGVVATGQASIVDVVPTIVELIDAPDPRAGERDGHSLLEQLLDPDHPGTPAYAESMFPELEYGWQGLRTLRADGFKYIAAPEPELYELRRDPRERTNIASRQPERAAEMRARLEDLVGADVPERLRLTALDEATAGRLRALGYLGGGSAAPTQTPLSPLEIVTRIEAFEDGIERAVELLDTGRGPAATRLLTELEELAPGHHVLLYYLGRAALLAGDTTSAIGWLTRAVQRNPMYSLSRIELAKAYWEARRIDDCFELLREAHALFPQVATFPLLHGTYLHQLDRLDEALAAYEAARRLAPRQPRLLSNLALLHLRTGNSHAALEALRIVLEETPEDPGAWNRAGMLHASLGDYASASVALRRSLEIEPGQAAVHYQLGLVLIYEAARELDAAANMEPGSDAGNRLQQLLRSGLLRSPTAPPEPEE